MSNSPVIAYAIDNSPSGRSNSLMEDNVYSSSLGDSKFADDTIEMSGNFFSQLDSMIAAVKVESSALDSMKEKLKEVENLRNQISNFTKRLLEADQSNLNLKSNLVKAQEMYAEVKKAKAEVESSIVPLRNELNRTKEQCNKERAGRLAAQQQIAQMKDQINMLENANENLDRDVKTIPALSESNEILKNDLSQLRRRYKEEKAQMQKHIKALEGQSRDVESIKGAVRDLSMKLLDVANGGGSGGAVPGSGTSVGGHSSSSAYMAQQQRMQQQQQPYIAPMRYGHQPQHPVGNNIYYQQQPQLGYGSHQNHQQQQRHQPQLHQQQGDTESGDDSYEEDDEEGDEVDESADYDEQPVPAGAGVSVIGRSQADEYDNESFAEVNSSLESAGSLVQAGIGASNSAAAKGSGMGSGGKKKKKVVRKKVGGVTSQQQQQQQGRQQQQPRMMQQLESSNSTGNLHHQQQQQQQNMYHQAQQYRGSGSGPAALSLPRI